MDTTELNTDLNKAVVEKGYIKLTKNTKGYNWEFKLYEDCEESAYNELINKIKRINELLVESFGNE